MSILPLPSLSGGVELGPALLFPSQRMIGTSMDAARSLVLEYATERQTLWAFEPAIGAPVKGIAVEVAPEIGFVLVVDYEAIVGKFTDLEESIDFARLLEEDLRRAQRARDLVLRGSSELLS